jgi:hypothetical protein
MIDSFIKDLFHLHISHMKIPPFNLAVSMLQEGDVQHNLIPTFLVPSWERVLDYKGRVSPRLQKHVRHRYSHENA